MIIDPSKACIYCGKPTVRGNKGEHIVPAAIGCTLTLNDFPNRLVCTDCNCGILSRLDNELCRRSYVSIIASQELGSPLWQVWDVDHAAGNQLIEACPVWLGDTLTDLITCPQITFGSDAPEYRGDSDQMMRFGYDEFFKVLVRSVRYAFGRFKAGEKRAINLEKIDSEFVTKDSYRFWPRVYSPHTIWDIARKIPKSNFVLRYVSDDDKRHALNCLDRLGEPQKLTRWQWYPGTNMPATACFFDGGMIVRGLLKIAVNLLAAYCEKTPVNWVTFEHVINEIKGIIPLKLNRIRSNGFVKPEDVEEIKCAPGTHSFRLVHVLEKWFCYFSFFGGRVCAAVRFFGPCSEDWNTLDVVAPFIVANVTDQNAHKMAKLWVVTKRFVCWPVHVTAGLHGISQTVPTLVLYNSVTSLRVKKLRDRKQ